MMFCVEIMVNKGFSFINNLKLHKIYLYNHLNMTYEYILRCCTFKCDQSSNVYYVHNREVSSLVV